MPDIITSTMLKLAWTGMLLGVVSGAVIGLCFAREDWMGGYSGWRRRLTRLGHISFFGLGFVNFFFASHGFFVFVNDFRNLLFFLSTKS